MLTIQNPIITEKSLTVAQNGVYTFMVADSATRSEVAKAVESLYGVKVSHVRIQNVKGQVVRQRSRRGGLGQRKDWKKALVTLEKGSVIKDFELAEVAAHDHDHDHDHDHAADKKKK